MASRSGGLAFLRAFGRVRLATALSPARRARLQRRRFREIVAWSRRRSPAYSELYAGVPEGARDPSAYPPSDKAWLMERFDRWITDPRIDRAGVEAFMARPENLGRPYGPAGVLACRTSGSSGVYGVILHDRRALSTYAALWVARGYLEWLGPLGLVRASVRRKWVNLMADSAHYAGASFTRWAIDASRRGRRSTILPTSLPREEILREMRRLRPSVLSGYPSKIAALVAGANGDLGIRPRLVVASAEALEDAMRTAIEGAFLCPVRSTYTASELPAIAFECERRWLHVNDDVAFLEPVDSAGTPVPPGTVSATVLLTNLVNRVQPIVRYDLADQVLVRPDPCECGSGLPAIRVEGRKQELLRFEDERGAVVAISGNDVLDTIECAGGIATFQAIQTGRRELRVRLAAAEAERDAEVWERVKSRVETLFAGEGLPGVAVERDPTPPRADERSGKFHAAWSEIRGEP